MCCLSKSVPVCSKLEKVNVWLCRCVTEDGLSWLDKECLNINYALGPINKNSSTLYARNPLFHEFYILMRRGL